ncbi:CAP domain-containing protein [Vagococcus carniphilus]|uniref:CAP domain-containing protein n=1 Tax=Vagococcus carniphilus TaxID=218144 RepID=UPI00288ED1F0|nr:CAP domain-containing protein [Vagococcus carniphilus]MDT2831249.1 CAP domain-containing protein [Vagococcus carniphilus]MDT2839592.1 CAP domain-containing protein [Vagococcus carniphilus]MDT2854061.1 CAP domain-containing protein [Vagococcus carniphilus]
MKKRNIATLLSVIGLFGLASATLSNAEEVISSEKNTIESSIEVTSSEVKEVEKTKVVEEVTQESSEVSKVTADTTEEIAKMKAVLPEPAKKLPQGDYISDGSYVQIIKKNYKIWANFEWKQKNNSTKFYQQILYAKGRYEHSNGDTYYSIFDRNNKWQGYINAKATKKVAIQGDYVKDGSFVKVKKVNYNIWQDFNWKKKGNTKAIQGKTLQARGRYEHFNGSTYYSLFDGKGKWQGYLSADAVTKTTAQGDYIKDNSYVTIKNKNYDLWKNFNWQSKGKSSQLVGKTLQVKARYEHFNGSTFYSVYNNKGTWYGYINATATSKIGAQGNYISDGSYIKITKKNYNIWQNFGWKKKNNTTKLYGKVLKARGRYEHFNGATYYSIFDSKGNWYGYLNSNAVTKTKAEGPYISDGRYVRVTKDNYDLWDNFKFDFRGTSENLNNQVLQARGRYEHFNGSTYYSLYDDLGLWRGYINAGATKKASKPTVELSAAEVKKAQTEMLRLVNNERRKQKPSVHELRRMTPFDTAANYRARELKILFEHERPDGSDIGTSLEEAGIDVSNIGLGENIAYNMNVKNNGKEVARKLFKQWMNSEGHRKNMLSDQYDYIGLGFFASEGRVYGAQLLIVVD